MRKLSLLSKLALLALMVILVMPAQSALYKYSSSPNIPLPDRGTIMDNIYVPTDLDIAEVRVGIYMLHSDMGDTQIRLRGPNGLSSILKALGAGPLGPLGSQQVHALFREGGPGNIGLAISPRMDTYAPSTTLTVFGGKKAMGWWTLIIDDGYNGDAGHLVSWDLEIMGGTVVPPMVLFTQNGSNIGYFSGIVGRTPPVGSGGGKVWGSSADIYPNLITTAPGSYIIGGGPGGRLTVSVDIQHTWDSDMQIWLHRSSGPTQISPPSFTNDVELSTGNGGAGDDMQVTFDDLAAATIVGFTPPGGFGRFKPEGSLASLNGLSVNGNWWLENWDNVGGDFGFINSWSINYELAGYNVLAPIHQSIASPLLGIQLPAGITNAIIGYVPDIVSTVPPYSVTSKLEQPTFAIWTHEKQGVQYATGFERIEVVNSNGGNAHTGYWGPFAYNTDGVAYVNADLPNLTTEGRYKIKTSLTSRNDDDISDNVAYSGDFDVTSSTLAYHGSRMTAFSIWQYSVYPPSVGYFTMGANSQYAMAFTVFKFPNSKLTSVNLFLDSLGVSNTIGDSKIVIYNVAQIWTGNPQNIIAESPILPGVNRMHENWYTYPIGPVGVGTGGIDLTPGTYVVSLQTLTGTLIHYRYYFPMARTQKDGYWGYSMMTQNFGPILPIAQGSTKLLAYSTSLTSAPTTNTNMSGGNAVMSFRMNFVQQNDFAIDLITPRGAMNIAGAPFSPVVKVRSCSPHATPQGFNIIANIYNTVGQKVYSNEKVSTVAGYGTTDITFNGWTPTSPGNYTLEAYFTRNPQDQNKTNDKAVVRIVVFQTGSAMVYDDATSSDVIEATKTELAERGETNLRMINRSKETVDLSQFGSIFWIGKTTAEEQNQIRAAVDNGAQIAMVLKNNDLKETRTFVENVDKIFQVERSQSVNYDRIKFGDQDDPNAVTMEQSTPPAVKLDIKSKEDLMKYFEMSRKTLEVAAAPVCKTEAEKAAYLAAEQKAKTGFAKPNPEELLYPVVKAPYGDMTLVTSSGKEVAIVFVLPSKVAKNNLTTTAATPVAFELKQNFPNPFNPQTTINYNLPEASHVDLRVFDALGREVTTLVTMTQNAGNFTTTWKGIDNNGASVASGVYFYRLEATPVNGGQSFISMKKMTYSK